MAMCTYTVAVVFLYYLACTFVFLYVTRTEGHMSYLKFFIESTFNIGEKNFVKTIFLLIIFFNDLDLGAFSLKLEIILSAVFTVIIYGCQLIIGMQNTGFRY